MKNHEIAKEMWRLYVPKDGQADTVQGELLRSVEKLRWEAQKNGNINWDDSFVLFCDYIENVLTTSNVFNFLTKRKIRKRLNSLRNWEFFNLKIEDEFYNEIVDWIAEWYLSNKEPITHKKDPRQYR